MRIVNVILLLFYFVNLSAQVGIGTTSPDNSAALELEANDKGFLPPRITENQRNNIENPAEGLMIYNLTTHQLNFYNGTEWMNYDGTSAATPQPEIGDSYQGGKIFYIFQQGDSGFVEGETHGLIAALGDQSSGTTWGCNGTAINTTNENIGAGKQNTLDILAGCSSSSSAAKICSNLVIDGFDDWYLPSRNELIELYSKRQIVGGFSSTVYWSSSEPPFFQSENVRTVNFSNGNAGNVVKTASLRVRAIRSF